MPSSTCGGGKACCRASVLTTQPGAWQDPGQHFGKGVVQAAVWASSSSWPLGSGSGTDQAFLPQPSSAGFPGRSELFCFRNFPGAQHHRNSDRSWGCRARTAIFPPPGCGYDHKLMVCIWLALLKPGCRLLRFTQAGSSVPGRDIFVYFLPWPQSGLPRMSSAYFSVSRSLFWNSHPCWAVMVKNISALWFSFLVLGCS